MKIFIKLLLKNPLSILSNPSMDLIRHLIETESLKTPAIISAFQKIKRIDFLPSSEKDLANLNEALPIDCEQTISQPQVVAFMLELLQPKSGEKILDIGSGSGWTSALLAEIVSLKGKIIAIEIIPKLKEFGENNVAKYSFIKKGIVEFFCIDGSKGCPNISSHPKFSRGFDKILCSAEIKEIPKEWKKQLKKGGRIVTPLNDSIWLFEKISENKFKSTAYPGFVFCSVYNKQKIWIII